MNADVATITIEDFVLLFIIIVPTNHTLVFKLVLQWFVHRQMVGNVLILGIFVEVMETCVEVVDNLAGF